MMIALATEISLWAVGADVAFDWIGLDGLDWIGLDWIDWIGLD